MHISVPFHVLIIEDSPEDRADIRQMLLRGSQRHYKFTEAETGAAGMRALLDHPHDLPDCVVLDFNLPDMNALDLLAEWQAGTPSPGWYSPAWRNAARASWAPARKTSSARAGRPQRA